MNEWVMAERLQRHQCTSWTALRGVAWRGVGEIESACSWGAPLILAQTLKKTSLQWFYSGKKLVYSDSTAESRGGSETLLFFNNRRFFYYRVATEWFTNRCFFETIY